MQDDSLTKLSVRDFLERLAAPTPVPGGGSAAALAGALAAGLGHMAATLTLGKPRFADVAERVRSLAERLGKAGQMLRQLIDEDAAAYGELSSALKVDKSDPQRRAKIQQAATLAAEVPLQTATLAQRVLADLGALKAGVNPSLQSDVEAASHLARAAVHAAAANVRVNLPLMDPQAAAEVGRQLESLPKE